MVARGRDNMLEALMSIDCIPAFDWLESISTSYSVYLVNTPVSSVFYLLIC